jgi:hypothetical protein
MNALVMPLDNREEFRCNRRDIPVSDHYGFFPWFQDPPDLFQRVSI